MPSSTSRSWKFPLITLAVAAVVIVPCLSLDVWSDYQKRNMTVLLAGLIAFAALLIWWMLFSRFSMRQRLSVLGLLALPFCLYRVRVSGDFVPSFDPYFWGRGKFHVVNAEAGKNAARGDFPQFLGPSRDGKLAGPVLDPDWKAKPPQIVWRKSFGDAWSGFAIADGKAVTQEQADGQEWVTCVQLENGNELWRTPNPGSYSDALAGKGPRATPTIVDGRVYTLGSTGILQCLRLSDGKALWTRDLCKDAGVKMPEWGFSSSPLVHEGKVIVSAGGKPDKSLVAYHAESGEIAWMAGNGGINYSSPFLRTVAGKPQILMLNADVLSSHDPATGQLLWEHGWPSGRPNVAQPLVVDGSKVFISSGYAYGSELIQVARAENGSYTVEKLWKSARFQAKFSNPVERGGYIYGVSDGDMACLDAKDGARKWKGNNYGHGQGLMVGEHYLQVAETRGELVLLRPTPEGPNELGRFPVFSDKTWNTIALSGDLLLMRNDREAACIKLPLAPVSAAR